MNQTNIQNTMTQYEQLLAIRKMNRKQKRELAKKLKISYQELLEATSFKIEDITVEDLPDGTKVRLKKDRILEKESELNPKYVEWVNKNAEKIFTCEKDLSLPEDSKRVILKEDETEPKWLFHVTDLELVL